MDSTKRKCSKEEEKIEEDERIEEGKMI